MGILDWSFLGNTGREWLMALLLGLGVLGGLPLVVRGLVGRIAALAERTETELDDLIAQLLKNTRFFFYFFVALYAATRALTVSPRVAALTQGAFILALLLQGALWGNGAITFLVGRYRRRLREEDPATATTVGALGFIGRFIVWALILLLALDNLGFDVTALVTTLGIGGIAVGLAVQNILSDLLASFSIVLDKPFVIGDFIIVGDLMGTVEHVGLKTTRIRSLSGEQLVFSNTDLLGSRIRNYKRMEERRILFTFGVVYQTPAEKLERIPEIVREIIEAQPNTRFDRAHFKAYGDSSLDFEIVYYMLVPDYVAYMDTQQAINLAIFRRFAQEGIEFAYPTRTVYVTAETGAPAAAGAAGA